MGFGASGSSIFPNTVKIHEVKVCYPTLVSESIFCFLVEFKLSSRNVSNKDGSRDGILLAYEYFF